MKIFKRSIVFIIAVLHYYIVLQLHISLIFMDIELYINAFWVNIIYVTIYFFLIECPIYKYICNNFFYRLLYVHIPIELLLFVYFCQFHTWGILLLLLLIFFETVLWLKKDIVIEENKSRKIIKVKKSKHSILLTFFVLLIPVLVSIFYYRIESPLIRSDSFILLTSEQIKQADSDEVKSVNPYNEHLAVFAGFQEEEWKTKNGYERINSLQDLANFECDYILKMPRIEVQATLLDSDIICYYDNDQKKIVYNLVYLLDDSSEDCILHVLHEVNHGYIYSLIGVLDTEYGEMSYFDDLRLFKENLINHYETGENEYESYYNQPVEKEARYFAKKELNKIRLYID